MLFLLFHFCTLCPFKKQRKQSFQVNLCDVLTGTCLYYQYLQLKTNKSSYLMFMAFMSNLLHQDIYARLHQLWASPSWKQMDASIGNSHHCAFQKCSYTIQKSLNQTRTLAAAAQLLNITVARGKLFMPSQGEIQSSLTSEDTLQVSVNTP